MIVHEIRLRDYLLGQAMTRVKPPVEYMGEAQTGASYEKYACKVHRMVDAVMAKSNEHNERGHQMLAELDDAINNPESTKACYEPDKHSNSGNLWGD